MHILLITEYFPIKPGAFTGGVETRTYYITKELAKKHKITVICSRTIGSPVETKINGATVLRVGPERKYGNRIDLRWISFIREALIKGRNIDADIIEGSNFVSHFIAYRLARQKELPCVAWIADIWRGKWVQTMRSLSGIVLELIERYSISRPWTKIIALSKTVAKKIEKAGVPNSKVTIIPGGVDTSLIQSIIATKNKKLKIVVIARLVHYKSIDTLIRAVPYIAKKYPDLKVTIIGQGPEEKKLKNLVKKLSLMKYIYFAGFIPDYESVLKLLKSSTLFCLPSIIEGFGIVTIESMAAGVPFINADIEVNKEITQKKGGLFFQPRNPKDLANKAILLLSDKKLYRKMKIEAVEKSKEYDWMIIAKSTEDVYQSAILDFKKKE